MRRLRTLSLVAVLVACRSSASDDALARLQHDTGVPWVVLTDPELGTPDYLQPGADPGVSLGAADAPDVVALAFLAKYGGIFHVEDPARELVLDAVGGPDVLGIRSASFTQKEGAVPVYGTLLSVQFDKDGRIAFVSGTFAPNLRTFATQPTMTPSAALSTATADMATRYAPDQLATPESIGPPALVIEPRGTPTLVYRVHLSYVLPETFSGGGGASVMAPLRVGATYVLDALSGAILDRADDAATQYAGSGSQIIANSKGSLGDTKAFDVIASTPPADPPYYMQSFSTSFADTPDESRRFVRLPSTNVVSSSSLTDGWDVTAVDAYVFFQQADQWWRRHGRASFDGKGAPIAIVTRDPDPQNNDTMWWDAVSAFHVGSNSKFAVAAVDDAGHEFQHAVTQYSLRLDVFGQTGALNESLSDVFGQIIEHDYPQPGSDAGLLGEVASPPGGIRSLQSPHDTGQPDNVADPLFAVGPADRGGVHANMGIPDNAWWLTTFGGTNGTSQIEIPASIALGWQSTDLYLSMVQNPSVSPIVRFHGFATALHGKANAISDDPEGPRRTVACAWYAVGVLSEAELKALGIKSCVDDRDGGSPTDAMSDAPPPPDGGTGPCALVSAFDVELALGLSDVTGPIAGGAPIEISCRYSGANGAAAANILYDFECDNPQAPSAPLCPTEVDLSYSTLRQQLASMGWTVVDVALGDAAFAASMGSTTSLVVRHGVIWFEISAVASVAQETTLAQEILSKL